MRTEGFKYRDQWLPNYFPSREIAPGRHLRLSRHGTTQILTPEQDRQLEEIFMEDELYERLERTGHILTKTNALETLDALKTWHTLTYRGPALHIVVLTKRCNLNCTYCHMNPEHIGASPDVFDMKPEVADAVIGFALSSPSPFINFEFQGGEPFLNFEGMKYFVTEAKRRAAETDKRIDFCVVSNLMLVKDEQIEFCREHGINVSYSLNGPRELHDLFRRTRSNTGSFDRVMKRIREIQEKFPGVLSTSPLCVIGADNAKDLIPMIDFYHEQGFQGVAILKLKYLGNTVKTDLGFDIREFLKYYIEALDYLLEKNKELGASYSERMVRVLLSKITGKFDCGFVDWRNPVGDFGSAITYDYDGHILPSDEARSLRHEFGLGNVLDQSYEDLVQRRETFKSMNLSLRDRDSTCRECAFNPYCGVLPVLDYARTGNPAPVPHESEECIQTMALLDWLFARLEEDPIPLFRMLPGMDDKLVATAAEIDAEAAGG